MLPRLPEHYVFIDFLFSALSWEWSCMSRTKCEHVRGCDDHQSTNNTHTHTTIHIGNSNIQRITELLAGERGIMLMTSPHGQQGATLMHYACCCSQPEVVRFLHRWEDRGLQCRLCMPVSLWLHDSCMLCGLCGSSWWIRPCWGEFVSSRIGIILLPSKHNTCSEHKYLHSDVYSFMHLSHNLLYNYCTWKQFGASVHSCISHILVLLISQHAAEGAVYMLLVPGLHVHFPFTGWERHRAYV